MVDYFFFTFLMIFMVVTVGEWIFASLWLSSYFRYGLPLFRKEIQTLNSSVDLHKYTKTIELNLITDAEDFHHHFKTLSEQELAFTVRPKHRGLFRSSRESQGHGIIIFDVKHQKFQLIGYLSWIEIVFPMFILVPLFFAPFSDFSITTIFFIFVILVSLSIIAAYKHWTDYGRIYTAMRLATYDRTIFPNRPSPSEIQVPKPTIETYDPFASQKPQYFTELIFIGIILTGLLAYGIVTYLFWSTFTG